MGKKFLNRSFGGAFILTSFFIITFTLVADVTMETSPGSSISMEHRLDVELRASSSSSSTSLSSGSGPGPRPGG